MHGRDGQPLLNAADPIVDSRKFTDYALNETSLDPRAASKARLFRESLGYTKENYASLERQIRDALPRTPARLGDSTEFGVKFVVDAPVRGPNGRTVVVRSVWQYDNGAAQPRLITTYPK